MLSPIGNSYGYYTSSPYATGHTAASARTALLNGNHAADLEVQAVPEVPEVYSNEETERVQRTPEEQLADKRTAYEIMTALTPRNAEQLNVPLAFMTKKPYTAEGMTTSVTKSSASAKPVSPYTSSITSYGLGDSHPDKLRNYEAQQIAYRAYTLNYNGFYASA